MGTSSKCEISASVDVLHISPASYFHVGLCGHEGESQSSGSQQNGLQPLDNRTYISIQTLVEILRNFFLLSHYILLFHWERVGVHRSDSQTPDRRQLFGYSLESSRQWQLWGWQIFSTILDGNLFAGGRGVSIGTSCLLSVFRPSWLVLGTPGGQTLKCNLPSTCRPICPLSGCFICW